MSTRSIILIITALVIALGATLYFIFLRLGQVEEPAPAPTPAVIESPVVGSNAFPELLANTAYVAAQRLYDAERAKPTEERNFVPVVEKYVEASESALSKSEEAQALFMAASVESLYDPVGSIERFRSIALDESSSNRPMKAGAFEQMVMVYSGVPKEEVFEAIFQPPLDVLVADSEENRIDTSMVNLLTQGSGMWPLATIELRLASAKIDANANTTIPSKLVAYCRLPNSIVDDECKPDAEQLLTEEELDVYHETVQYVRDRLKAADSDMRRMRNNGEYGILLRAHDLYATVTGKSLLYNIATPGEVKNAFEETIRMARERNNIDVEARAVLNYAVFLRLWWWNDTEAAIVKIKELLSGFYVGDKYAHADLVPWLQSVYASEITSPNDAPPRVLRGTLMLTTTDEDFKNFLISDLGWDFAHPKIQAFFAQ